MRVTTAVSCMSAIAVLATSEVLHAEQPPDSAILATVTEALAKQLGTTADKIHPDAKFSALTPAPDELDVVELLMTLEEKFKIEITDAAIADIVGSSELQAIASNLTARSLSHVVSESLE